MRSSLITRLDARDRALFLQWSLASSPERTARHFWRTITHVGGATCTIAVALVAIALGGAWREGGARALEILVLSHLAVQLVKRSVGRPRPSRGTSCATLIAEPDRFSFPSGHAAAAMSLALGFSFVVPQWGALLGLVAVVVGFSRVALAVHYPGDVIVGQLLAIVTAALVWAA